jgi:hypothetical protein
MLKIKSKFGRREPKALQTKLLSSLLDPGIIIGKKQKRGDGCQLNLKQK